jgi:hypothetical protein
MYQNGKQELEKEGIHNKQTVVISTCIRNGSKNLKRRQVAELCAYAQLDICNTNQ